MSTEGVLNPTALEPLFAPWEEPSAHRVRGDAKGSPAKAQKGRRPSAIAVARNLRGAGRGRTRVIRRDAAWRLDAPPRISRPD